MNLRKLRNRLAASSALMIAILAGTLVLGTGVATAGPSIPAYPAVGVYPDWLTTGTGCTGTPPTGCTAGTENASEDIRGAGSDTNLFVQEQISDLYNNAGLYGCTLLSTTLGQCDNESGSAPDYSNTTTTDTNDNFDRTEVLQGVNLVGSSNGQQQLCGQIPTPDNVDYARSSKPQGGSSNGITICSNLYELGYAKDEVPGVDFQTIDPQAVGGGVSNPSPFFDGQTFTFTPSGGSQAWTSPAFPANGIGPVAAGWLPGDPYNCVPAGSGLEGTACSGTPFNNMNDTVDGTTTGAFSGDSSVPYRIWCASDNTRITDWGELTNLNIATLSSTLSTSGAITSLPVNALTYPVIPQTFTITSGANSQQWTTTGAAAGATSIPVTSQTPNFAYPSGTTLTASVGNGDPIGVPVRVIGINNGSGTVSTFTHFADAGATSNPNCGNSSFNDNNNAASGPNPLVNNGNSSSNDEIAIENDAGQVGDFAYADFNGVSGNAGAGDEAVEIATSLYYISYGVSQSNPNADTSTVETNTTGGPTLPAGVPATYTGTLMTEDNISVGNNTEGNDSFPTARTLYSIYNTNALRATTAGYLNWICGANETNFPGTSTPDPNSTYNKELDITFGKNFDTELSNIISQQFNFIRLTDQNSELKLTGRGTGTITPADNISGGGLNAQCDAQLPVTATGTNVVTISGSIDGEIYSQVPSPQAFNVGQPAVGASGAGIPSGTTVSVAPTAGATTLTLSNSIPTGTYVLYFPGIEPILQGITSPNT